MRSLLQTMLLLFLSTSLLHGQQTWGFDFGKETHALHTNIILHPQKFSNSDEFGFDFENYDRVEILRSEGEEIACCTAPVPFYFSVRVPEGNYRVRVRIGHPYLKSITTIKAEARRLMVSEKQVDAGKSLELQFNVSIRSPQIRGDDSIRLKPREYNYMNWDNRLSLEFSGENQSVQHISIEEVNDVTTLFLAGNSTVCDQDLEPWASWGQMITPYFNEMVVVANYAESGESLASFKSSGRLEKVLDKIRPGDYLFIEFGHNDQKRRGQGIGPWDSYADLLREFATRAREEGAIPVFLTPTQRRSFGKKRKIISTHGEYPAAMRSMARELDVPLIDLNEMTRVLFESWGPGRSKKAFVHYRAGTFPEQDEALEDNTHFSAFGAHEIALCVLKGIRDQDLPLAGYILDSHSGFDPAKPHKPGKWKVPESPRYVSTPPAGN